MLLRIAEGEARNEAMTCGKLLVEAGLSNPRKSRLLNGPIGRLRRRLLVEVSGGNIHTVRLTDRGREEVVLLRARQSPGSRGSE